MYYQRKLSGMLLEQTSGASLIKNKDTNTMLRIARMLEESDFSTRGRVGEDIVALLVGGKNTNEGRDPTIFKDVVVGNVVISVKGAAPGRASNRVARDNIKLNAEKIAAAGDDEDVALVIVTTNEDNKQLFVDVFGPTEREVAMDALKLGGFTRSMRGLNNVFGEQHTETLQIPDVKNAEAMRKFYDIRRVVSGMNDGDEIAAYLQTVADEIKKVWKK